MTISLNTLEYILCYVHLWILFSLAQEYSFLVEILFDNFAPHSFLVFHCAIFTICIDFKCTNHP